MKRVKEETKYLVGLLIMFAFAGAILIALGMFALYLAAYITTL